MGYKYEILISILDKIRFEAPASYKSYLYDDTDKEKADQARSMAFIHLFLKVRFGITSFLDRHKLITDDSYDGGLDAYYIDYDQKKLYLLQSKFRTTEDNFENKSMNAEDLLKMEISRITKGSDCDSKGNKFNSKVIAFQEELKSIRDIARYDFIVILLGNVFKYSDEQIRRLIDNFDYIVFDSDKAYRDLVFPLVCGTYYNPDEIIIKLELTNKEHPKLKQLIETEFGQYNITAIFVPTYEIAKIMLKYKNAILIYNPRNFLSLKKKSVNQKIRESIINQDKNNFALLNNGITLLSNNINISESTGKKNEGQLILTNPQILNGGQTAYTLSTILEEFKDKPVMPLHGKEVLLKVITPIEENSSINPKFIELISNATNQQNEVSEADRRSNHEIQIELQNKIYDNYGYLYERKQGEFHEGINDGYINTSLVINRLTLIKAYWAYLGEPAAARRTSEDDIFQEDSFYKIMNNIEDYKAMFFAYKLFNKMEIVESGYKSKNDTKEQYGYSLLYGKWAVVASIGILNEEIPCDLKALDEKVDKLIMDRLILWKSFDDFIKTKHDDSKYFNKSTSNYELFYKINFLDEDIREFFLK